MFYFTCNHGLIPKQNNRRQTPLKHTIGKGIKDKGWALAIALVTRELVTRSTLKSQKWQLIGMS